MEYPEDFEYDDYDLYGHGNNRVRDYHIPYIYYKNKYDDKNSIILQVSCEKIFSNNILNNLYDIIQLHSGKIANILDNTYSIDYYEANIEKFKNKLDIGEKSINVTNISNISNSNSNISNRNNSNSGNNARE
jgi:hypothetical protein